MLWQKFVVLKPNFKVCNFLRDRRTPWCYIPKQNISIQQHRNNIHQIYSRNSHRSCYRQATMSMRYALMVSRSPVTSRAFLNPPYQEDLCAKYAELSQWRWKRWAQLDGVCREESIDVKKMRNGDLKAHQKKEIWTATGARRQTTARQRARGVFLNCTGEAKMLRSPVLCPNISGCPNYSLSRWSAKLKCYYPLTLPTFKFLSRSHFTEAGAPSWNTTIP